MAEFLVDKLLDVLATPVLEKLQEEFKLVTGVKDEVKNFSSNLQIISTMLQDVQRRKLKEKPVGIWLEKLEDVAYDMDDVLDEWNTEIQKLKLKAHEDPNSLPSQLKKMVPKDLSNKVSSFLLSISSCFKEVSARHEIAHKIKKIDGRMDMIFLEGKQFNFDVSDPKSTSEDQFKRVHTTSIVDESEVCGRESDKDTIVSQLLSDTSNANDVIRIVSIVGTGGIGKTTLAQLANNDNRVSKHFQLRKWVCVSDTFDEKRIAKAILEGSEKSSPDVSELDTLVQRIKELISRKKFLLVLDDVWTEDCNKWKPIWDSLKDGAPGSRILVTTRNQRVAKMMGTYYMHPLNELRDSDCWEILSRRAFLERSKNEKLEKIGLEISKKCKGLPLAANFLGSLLQSKDTEEQWKNVLESEIWELEEATIGLFPHIYLSYNELSPAMKRCFLYCAIFPKGHGINVKELIRLWMAQGYLCSRGRVGELESRGYECFSNLAMRSFFQNFRRDEFDEPQIASCKMHDIVHDFAQHLVNGECLLIENLDEAKNLSFGKVRHLRWSIYGDDVAVSAIGSNVEKLRSFYCTRKIDAFDLVGCLKCVRILSLQNTKLEEVSRAVGNLIHLRFLNLSGNRLKVLPEEICELYNLETLDISFCDKLTQLPQRIGDLLNLRHLLNRRTYSLKQFPRGLQKLTSLRTLREFKVGNGYNKFEDLRNLNQLGGDLRIDFYVVNEGDFDTATLGNKAHIQRMSFYFWGESTNYASVTESLQTPPNLEFLDLFQYPNSNLPSWIMSLNNVRRLEIQVGNQLASLPALGKLPSLEVLELDDLDGIEYLSREFLGITEESPVVGVPIFPKLKKLRFWGLLKLRIWEDLREEDENVVSAVMPCLQELYLIWCSRLEMLPHRLLRMAKSPQVLELDECDALRQRYRTSGEGWIHVSHIPNVVIDKERQVTRI